jgi:Phage integrase, N-terminal SAM-like domain
LCIADGLSRFLGSVAIDQAPKCQLDWLASLSREQRQKLSDKGLIEPEEPEAVKEEKLLSEYLTEYFESRQAEVKPRTWIFYQLTWDRLNDYFKDRTLLSITASDAKAFRKWLSEASNKREKKIERKSLAKNGMILLGKQSGSLLLAVRRLSTTPAEGYASSHYCPRSNESF